MCIFAAKICFLYNLLGNEMLKNDTKMRKNSVHKRNAGRPDHVEIYAVQEETTLLPFLFQVLAPRSRTDIKSILGHSHVKVNDRATTQFDFPLRTGDEIIINFTHPFLSLRNRMVRLMYEDPDIIVIEKQSGLLTVPAGNNREKTAQKIVEDYVYASDGHSHAYVCHRLDQYTSGILIFAKNSFVQQQLRDSWNVHVVERRYMAVCENAPKKMEGEIRSYLAENSAMKVYSTNDPEKGKLSVTRYKCLKVNGDYCQMDIQILTGRKNQIRVHMSNLGCPVAGDKKYGAHSNPCGRLMLHNYVLQFIHPITRENMRFELPIPAAFCL